MKKKVIFILGIGRSGSTLLNYMLGSHPKCFDLNEISKLPEFYNKRDRNQEFWETTGQFWEEKFTPEELKMLIAGLSNHRINPYIPLKAERFVRETLKQDKILNPYSMIFSKIHETVLIDSSKYIDWVSQKLNAREFRQGMLDAYLIHLIRDGRAVLNSYLRWDKTMTVEKFSQRWSRLLQEDQSFYNQFPSDRKMIVRYEELATAPEATLQKICDRVQIDYEPEMIDYWKHDHYGICGNFGTRSMLAKYKGKQTDSEVKEVHGDYYEKQGFKIKLDLRWKNELDPEKVEQFYQLVGDSNKPFEWN